jgi:uncharacterized protein YfaQ (DUF2300 family)
MKTTLFAAATLIVLSCGSYANDDFLARRRLVEQFAEIDAEYLRREGQIDAKYELRAAQEEQAIADKKLLEALQAIQRQPDKLRDEQRY